MAVASTLKRDLKDNLILLLQVLNSTGGLKAQYHLLKSSPALFMFLATAIGTTGVSTFVFIAQYIKERREQNDSRPYLLHRQNSSVTLQDGNKEIFIPYNGKKTRVRIKPVKQSQFEADRRLFLSRRATVRSDTKTGVNMRFIRQFNAIWSIVAPRLFCKSTALLLLHAIFLFFRTYLSVLVARLDGRIVRDLISVKGKSFIKGIVLWFLLAFPASYTNAAIKYLQRKIGIEFRTHLTRYIHDLYLDSKLSYYHVSNIDESISNIDQYITSDVEKFCTSAASLYSSLGKPFVDLLLFTYQLKQNLGPLAVIGIFGNYFASATLLKNCAPQFGKLAAEGAKLEGDYRYSHTRLITNSEEIAFYDGTNLERSSIEQSFKKLMIHKNKVSELRFSYNMIEDITVKYFWSALGYAFSSIPIFLPILGGHDSLVEVKRKPIESLSSESPKKASSATKNVSKEVRGRMRQFITNKRLMLSLADAGSRMMYAIKDLGELAGYTSRVFTLISTLHQVHSKSYKTLLRPEERIEPYSLNDIHGTIQRQFNGIRFEHVPIVIPKGGNKSGHLLIDNLTLTIKPGEHLLITGSNGVGKSSITKILGELWPVYRGLLSIPDNNEIMILPQRVYFCIGTLRDQIIYPMNQAEMISKGIDDHYLFKILRNVKLEYLIAREGGLNTIKEWKDVLSGGEKQRISIARLLFKNPKFALLDESTSAVSADIEGYLFDICKKQGITIISLSHRADLLKYHDARLTLGVGEDRTEWTFERMGTQQSLTSVTHEVRDLQAKLSKVDEWKQRVEEINKVLETKYQ